jgi:hypothetical protein
MILKVTMSRAAILGLTVLAQAVMPYETRAMGLTLLPGYVVEACGDFSPGSISQTCNGSMGTQVPYPIAPVAITGDVSGGHVEAYQTPGGWDLAGVSVTTDFGAKRTASAGAFLNIGVRNDSTVAIPMSFTVFIPEAQLELNLQSFVAPDRQPQAFIASELHTLRGTPLGSDTLEWRYQATLTSFNSDTVPVLNQSLFDTPHNVGGLVPSALSTQLLGHDPLTNAPIAQRTVVFSPFSAHFDLGDLLPGDSFVLRYFLDARFYTGENNPNILFYPGDPQVDGFAFLRDPTELGSTFLLNDQPLSLLFAPTENAIPEAPTLFVMLSALLGLLVGGRLLAEEPGGAQG